MCELQQHRVVCLLSTTQYCCVLQISHPYKYKELCSDLSDLPHEVIQALEAKLTVRHASTYASDHTIGGPLIGFDACFEQAIAEAMDDARQQQKKKKKKKQQPVLRPPAAEKSQQLQKQKAYYKNSKAYESILQRLGKCQL